jgi:Uma2 family endonuclease
MGFQVDQENSLIPDVSVVSPSRIVPETRGMFQSAPELAIQVISSEEVERLEEKIERYLANGSKSVRAVFPKMRVVRIFDAAGGSKKFERNETLGDPALTGFRVQISAIFESV